MGNSFRGFLSPCKDRIGTKTMSTKQKKIVTAYLTSSVNSFNSMYSYGDGDNYMGILSSNGSYYLYSGSYTPSDSFTATTTQSSTLTDTTPSTVYYSSGGYSGTLNKTGTSSTVVSGSYTPGDSFTATDTRKSSPTDTTPSTVSYSSNGYTGTLSKTRTTSTVTSGSASDSKYITYNVSQYGGYYSGSTYYYDDGTYSGTLGSPAYTQSTVQTSPGVYQTLWTVIFKGTVTKPDTRVYSYTSTYSGMVTRPASDTRVYSYTSTYSGTVTRPAVDTRVYRQDYSGIVYLGGQNKKFRRVVLC